MSAADVKSIFKKELAKPKLHYLSVEAKASLLQRFDASVSRGASPDDVFCSLWEQYGESSMSPEQILDSYEAKASLLDVAADKPKSHFLRHKEHLTQKFGLSNLSFNDSRLNGLSDKSDEEKITKESKDHVSLANVTTFKGKSLRLSLDVTI